MPRNKIAEQSDSHQKTDFFNNFGKYELKKEQKKQELIKDYEIFKINDQKKFQNRFSDKKKQYYSSVVNNCSDTHELNESAIDDFKKCITVDEKLNKLENKIDCLHHDLNFSNSEHLNEFNANMCPSKYEDSLKKRLEMITDAEKRLSSVEDEYNRVKAMNTIRNTDCSINSSNRTNANSSINYLSAKLHDDPKLEQQRQYKFELESQIIENRKKRMQEKENKTDNILSPLSIERSGSAGYCTGKSGRSINHASTNFLTTGSYDLLNDSLSNINTTSDNFKLYNDNFITKSHSQDAIKVETINEKLKKLRYAEELKKQIEETKAKKQLQKQKDEEYDRKIEQQILNYESTKMNSTRLCDNSLHECSQNDHRVHRNTREISPVSMPVHPINTDTLQPNHARGGHGIFGSPLSEAQKTSLQKYKDDLAKQIAEKQKTLELQRLKETENDRRDMERIKADQIKMQKEYEIEKQKKERKYKTEENEFLEKKKELTKKLKEKSNEHSLEKCAIVQNKTTVKPNTCFSKKPSKTIILSKSPELLIGPSVTTTNNKTFSAKKVLRSEKLDDRTQTILNQLNNLRSQLDIEKSRIESELSKNKNDINYDNENTYNYKSHPKVDKRAPLFLNGKESNINFSGIDEHNKWEKIIKKDEIISDVDQKQVAFLKAHDKYLQDLKAELQQKHFVLSQARLKGIKQIPRPISEYSDNSLIMESGFPDERNLEHKMRSESNQSIDLYEITEKNQKRLKRLEALQLLGEVNMDPEAVLERFMTEHDELYLSNYKDDRL